MKLLSVVGTLAMFLVGGGILSHGVPALHHLGQDMSEVELAMPGLDASCTVSARCCSTSWSVWWPASWCWSW